MADILILTRSSSYLQKALQFCPYMLINNWRPLADNFLVSWIVKSACYWAIATSTIYNKLSVHASVGFVENSCCYRNSVSLVLGRPCVSQELKRPWFPWFHSRYFPIPPPPSLPPNCLGIIN